MSDEHYLSAITELGDTRRIIASSDICSENGTILVAAGIEITGKMYDRMVSHKLMPAWDRALALDDSLTPSRLLADLEAVIAASDKLQRMTAAIEKRHPLRDIVMGLYLPGPLAFKLTVAKEKYPRIYQHSLLLTAISIYLAHCDGMHLHDEIAVAMAALFQDVGLLHIDPRLLEPTHVMDALERRHLYTHPLSAFLLVSEFKELPRTIANAILEHHERRDGSGYPRGLRADQISRHGQILGVAALAAIAFDEGEHKVPWKKMDVILKMNRKKFGEGLLDHLSILRDVQAKSLVDEGELSRLADQVQLISKVFHDFNELPPPVGGDAIHDFARSRLMELQMSLFSTGIDPRDPESQIQMFMDDAQCMAEYVPILGEAIWQLRTLVQEVARQWPQDAKPAWFTEMEAALAPEPAPAAGNAPAGIEPQ